MRLVVFAVAACAMGGSAFAGRPTFAPAGTYVLSHNGANIVGGNKSTFRTR